MGIIDRVHAMKEWLTAAEIAAEGLPDMGKTERAIQLYAEREGWNEHPALMRQRAGRGGGTEYHYRILPTVAQVAYLQKYKIVGVATNDDMPAPTVTDTTLSERARLERDARLAIVSSFNGFVRGLNIGHANRVALFTDKYNAEKITVEPWVRQVVPTLSTRSLKRWRSAQQDGLTSALAVDPAKSRKGTGVLDTANGGAVRAFILACIASQPHLSADHVRKMCRSEFGDSLNSVSKGVEKVIDMPPVRTFRHVIMQLKSENHVILTKLTNPDLYRSTMAPSGVGTQSHITEPNMLWMIDASPVDALCTDGRHSMYACIDIATRRVVITISRTPRASAVALLIRKAILEWGVPDKIKTDNGSDFVAQDTKRLFASLGIEMELSDAYSPQQKGHVERVIGTFQRDFVALLPGYIGHSVADRKAIEGRKSFAARLGETDAETFGVSLNGQELAKLADEWVEKVYQHRPHSGLKGVTPWQAAAASSKAIRTVDARALDLLLMPVAGKDGQRTVTKFGVKIDHRHYMTPFALPGTAVFVRQDPHDLGKAYVFAQDGGQYLGEAVCPELCGIHPEAVVKAAKEMQAEMTREATRQIKADMKKLVKGPANIKRILEVAARDVPNVVALPKREEVHSTREIEAALDAMAGFGERLRPTQPMDERTAAEHRRLIAELQFEEEEATRSRVDAMVEQRVEDIAAARTAHVPDASNVVALPEGPKERYRRAYMLRKAIEAGDKGIDAVDGIWLGRYEQSAEFRAQAGMHEDFGDAYLAP
jgi:putative transposase